MRVRWRGTLAATALAVLSVAGVGIGGAAAATFIVNCPGDSIQAAVNAACSGDVVEVIGTCNESVTVGVQVAVCPTPGPFDRLTLRGRSKKGSGSTVIEGVGGPAITVTADAINIIIKNMSVGSNTSHGISLVSAHKVDISNVTTPSPGGTVDDGIHVDSWSTNTMISSSTLNGNPGDGIEMGGTYGQIDNVTADDNGAAGIHVTGSNADVQRCTAENTSAGNAQMVGFLIEGPAAIVQRSLATGNTVAQFHDTASSRGVIHFRNVAGDRSATNAPASGKGFWEEGSGNYITTCTSTRNKEEGVHLAGDGNQLQVTTSSENIGSQVLISGSHNLLYRDTATAVGTGNFASSEPAFHVTLGSMANFFVRCAASVSTTTAGDGYTIVDANNPDPTTTGTGNSRRPAVATDPPQALR